MHRVAIIGSAGSGKSTLARRLGEITGLPVVHIDTLF
jgi:adenylate kinase family enzyme